MTFGALAQRHANPVTCHLTFTAGVALLVRAGTNGSLNGKLSASHEAGYVAPSVVRFSVGRSTSEPSFSWMPAATRIRSNGN